VSEIVQCPHCGKQNRVPEQAGGVPRCAQCHEPLPWVVAGTEESFDEVVRTTLPVLVDLWAPWCGPCRTISPLVERAAERYAGHLKVAKVNVDDAPGISGRFGVQGIPTLLVLRNGRAVARQVGALSEGALDAWLRNAMGEPAHPVG